ncbi:MAG TPA: hypothetical protein V6D28_20275 [Leptolyngbyaceae cyanobacterium]
MTKIKSLAWVLGLSMVAATFSATPAKADHYPDITGTNIWNNTAPQFGRRGGRIDPQLVERVRRFNQESQEAYNACLAAVEAAERAPSGPRQFLRNPQNVSAEYPAACQRLNALRNERNTLASELERAGGVGSNPAYKAW